MTSTIVFTSLLSYSCPFCKDAVLVLLDQVLVLLGSKRTGMCRATSGLDQNELQWESWFYRWVSPILDCSSFVHLQTTGHKSH